MYGVSVSSIILLISAAAERGNPCSRDSDGNRDKALPFYRNCANIRISGGSSLATQSTDHDGKCAFDWLGGDRVLSSISNVNDIKQSDLDQSQCEYFNWNSVNVTAGLYTPDGLFTAGDGQMVDSSALRHGPPGKPAYAGSI